MVRMILTLTIICLVAATALSFVYQNTVPRIEEEKSNKLFDHLKVAFPSADDFVPIVEDTLWEARDDCGQKLGFVALVAPRGYAGPIETLVGFNLEGTIVGLRTATPSEGLKETPGLGVKVNDDWFQKQFIGKGVDGLLLKADGGSLDAITAATISSRAVVNGVRLGLERFSQYWQHEDTDTLVPEPDSLKGK
jgi:electron transport complex protein RnfG